jgi:cytochrome c biogenesis DsbD-like protein
MKKLIALCFFALSAFAAVSQTQNPVTWTATYKSISATEGEIVINAHIEKGWHTYSQKASTDGPIPTSFVFPVSKQFMVVGKTEESEAHEEFVKAFDAKIFVYTDKAEFRQKIKLTGAAGFPITFKLEYMSCNDMMCLPPKTIDLTVKVQ